jgi:hypothetical protein
LFVAINRGRSILPPAAGGKLETVPAAVIDDVLAKLAPLFD